MALNSIDIGKNLECDEENDKVRIGKKVATSPETRKQNDGANKVEVDVAFSWIVVAASFLCCFVIGLVFVGYSVLYLELANYFDSGMGAAGWVGSIYLAVGNIFGIFSGLVIERKGCRFLVLLGSVVWMLSFALSAFAVSILQLYFTYGLLGGFGFNMVLMSSYVIVQSHFKKYRSIAAGISAAGVSVGGLVSGPVIGSLVSNYGWRGTLLLLSGIIFNCCVFGCFYSPPRLLKNNSNSIKEVAVDESTSPDVDETNPIIRAKNQLKGMASSVLIRNSRFLTYCFSSYLTSFGTTIFYQHTFGRAVTIGLDTSSAYYISTVMGILTVISRIVGAAIGNAKYHDRVLQYALSILASGICLLSTGFAVTREGIFLVAGITGFCSGLVLTIQTTTLTDIVGIALLPRAQAIAMLFWGLGALLGPPLAGIIFDKTKNYDLPFYIAGALNVVGGLALAFVHLLLRKTITPNSEYLRRMTFDDANIKS